MNQINQLFLFVFLLCLGLYGSVREISKLNKRVFDLQERIELLEKK